MEMEQIEQPISDPHITSSNCLEIREMRMEAQKAAVEHVVRQIDVIAERTSERDEIVIRETKSLEQQLARVELEIAAITAMENILMDTTREEIKHMDQLYRQLSEKIPHMENLKRVLDYKRKANQATLHADPVFALILEEGRLKHQLEELGVHVPPPCDSDEQTN